MSTAVKPSIDSLKNVAARLRIDSIRSTTAAGSGHPTSCMSAAEIVATLFFAEMRYDPLDPGRADNDRFVLSKGHAAPVLYAAWAEAGLFPREQLLELRKFDSDLEGHPTPRLPFVDVATGSLGQGLCAGVGIALNARRIGSSYRTYVLLGDGESAEGSVWEAAQSASFHHLDTLCGIVDTNALGQSRPTQLGHDTEALAGRWRAFGWNAIAVDGHDIAALLDAFDAARRATGRPTMIVARTVKGQGVSFVAGREGFHGRPLTVDEADRAVGEIESQLAANADPAPRPPPPDGPRPQEPPPPRPLAAPDYRLGDRVATREAYGNGLVRLGAADERIVALDADVKNSTFSEKFEKAFPGRFFQNFIAEQVMVGAATGLAARGAIPFPSTFACFLSRAYDFIRMAGISRSNVKLAGSHAGISIGEDGPSQMGLEDLAMMRAVPGCAVLYPCDAVSTERLLPLMAQHPGPAYMRTSRPKTPVVYGPDEVFTIGGLKVLRKSERDAATVVAAGVTLYEALEAHDRLRKEGIAIRVIDLYSVQPIDERALNEAGEETGVLITVEDHYPAGGLGEAVAGAVAARGIRVHRLAVRDIPRSGTADELLEKFGISASAIVEAVRTHARR